MTACAIKVQGLCHTYMAGTPLAQQSLRGVDMEVHLGEVVAVIGATGSGKSTLLQHLNGLWRPQEGQVWVTGRDLNDPTTDLRQVRRTVGLVFQRPEDQLFEQYVGDDVAYGPRMAGLTGVELRDRVRWAMELVGLDFQRYKNRLIATLSGGERRKAGLAGVLAMRSQVLLLDEPTTGLDPAARSDLLARLNRLKRSETARSQCCAQDVRAQDVRSALDRAEPDPPRPRAWGMTLVIATHNMGDVAVMADRVYVLEEGRVALHGPTRQVFAQVERLRSLGLDVPPVTSVMAALRGRGLPVPLDVLTLNEAEAAILALSSSRDAAKRQGGQA